MQVDHNFIVLKESEEKDKRFVFFFLHLSC